MPARAAAATSVWPGRKGTRWPSSSKCKCSCGSAAPDNAGYHDLPLPDFGQYSLDDEDEEYDEDEGEGDDAGYSFASLADYIEAPVKKAIDPAAFTLVPESDDDTFGQDYAEETAIAEDSAPGAPVPEAPAPEAPAPEVPAPEDMAPEGLDDDAFQDTGVFANGELSDDAGLYDCLASARELARTADNTEDRSRNALYAAVSRAYDFSLAAQASPDDYAELIAESGLTVQERAPMTPVVKLVFGHDYDKTRLTEYAAVLTHAHRLRLEHGSLAGYLAETEGGVKAVVKAERSLRREEQGKPAVDAAAVREALAEQLRALEAISLEELDGAGPEFALAFIRRDEIGCAEIIAELPEDIALIERAARKMFG